MILAPPLRNPAYLFSNPKSHWRLDQNYLRGMGYYCIFDLTAASNNYNRDHVVGKIEKIPYTLVLYRKQVTNL